MLDKCNVHLSPPLPRLSVSNLQTGRKHIVIHYSDFTQETCQSYDKKGCEMWPQLESQFLSDQSSEVGKKQAFCVFYQDNTYALRKQIWWVEFCVRNPRNAPDHKCPHPHFLETRLRVTACSFSMTLRLGNWVTPAEMCPVGKDTNVKDMTKVSWEKATWRYSDV